MLEMRVRLIPPRSDKAAMALAIDSVLFSNMEAALGRGEEVEPIFRVHRFSKPAVIMSYMQKVDGRFDAELARTLGVDLTFRDTGGGHMYFGPDDIQYTFLAPRTFFEGDLIAHYRKVNSFIVEALKSAGYDAECGETSIRINDDGKKIVAGAARKYGVRSTLQQGGILVKDYTEDVFNLVMAHDWERRKWRENVTSLGRYGPSVREVIGTAYDVFDGDTSELSEQEEKDARALCREVYDNKTLIYAGTREQFLCMVAGRKKSDKDKIQVDI